MKNVLPLNFYEKHPQEVAQALIGNYLVREFRGKIIKGIITETEAYYNETDLASHARFGKTKRNYPMFGPAGKVYVYLIYGMYYCFNVVTEKKNQPSAVLIRAVKIKDVDYQKTNGPGKLTRQLRISKSLNYWNLTKGKKIWIEKGKKISLNKIEQTPRIGVEYAQQSSQWLWRFVLKF